MTKYTHPDVLDAALLEIAQNANSMVALDAYVTSYAGIAAATLATAAMNTGVSPTSGDDYTIAAGAFSESRKVSVAAKTDQTITAGGTAINVALLDTTSGGRVLHVAECTALVLVINQKVNFPTWDIIFTKPT
jgi:hypothetical protein